MQNVDLSEQQREEIKVAISAYFVEKKAIRASKLPELENELARTKLSKDFLDKHKEVAFHYQCSGRGLPASDYYMQTHSYLTFARNHNNMEHLINFDYISKIKAVKLYRKLRMKDFDTLGYTTDIENKVNYKVGYIFKPTHNEIHYLRIGSTGDRRKKYSNNYTTNFEEAATGYDEKTAKKFIANLVAKFQPDDDYKWTAVLVNADKKEFKRFMNGQWLEEAIKIPFIGKGK